MNRGFDGSFFARHFQQLGIELNEGMLDGGVLIVAIPAGVLAGSDGARRFRGTIKIEVGPLNGKTRLILDFDVQADERFLIAPLLIDRTVRSRTVNFQYKHRFVRPSSIGEEKIVGLWCYENICESRRAVSTRVRVIAHPKTGGNIHPSAIAFWTDEFAVRGELRAGRRADSGRAGGPRARGAKRNGSGEQGDEHQSNDLPRRKPPKRL